MLWFLAMGLVLSSCVCYRLQPDITLLRPWSPTLVTEIPFKGSYAANFYYNEKILLYIAGKHSVGLNSKLFILINQKISNFKPEIIILEGFKPEESQEAFRIMPKQCKPKFENCGEGIYAINLAPQETTIVTGEPSDRKIVDELTARGYQSDEIAFFYLVRQIPQMKRERILKSNDFQRQAEEYLKNATKRLHIPEIIRPYNSFIQWYQSKTKKPLILREINSETVAPYANGTYIQRLSYEVNLIRDSNVLQVIANQLNSHKRVMVLYGSSHLPVQLKVLEKMLGKPTYSQE